MPDYSAYKIEVVPGINDDPEPPNYQNNGKGCNGAYAVLRHNELCDALSFDAPVFTGLTGSISSTTIEVGASLLSPGAPITLSYTASNEDYIASVKFYAAGVAINNTSYAPGEVLSYELADYAAVPNIYLNSASHTWSAQGTDTRGDAIAGSASITVNWRYRTYWGWSASDNVTNYSALNGTTSSLTRPASVTKSATSSAEYLYIFLPISSAGLNDGWAAYTSFKVAGFDAVMASTTQQTITRLGVAVTYNVYRLFNPTSGPFTLNLT